MTVNDLTTGTTKNPLTQGIPRPQPIRDSMTMLRRNLRHMQRYPTLTLMLIGEPLVFLLLFVYVFGATMGRGLPGGGGGRSSYLTFITPAILVMAVATVALGTAISVAMDMTGGIIARFRTMAIARVSVLTGHVLGAMIQTFATVTVLLGAAVLLGFRPHASAPDWLAMAGILAVFAFALTWLTVALGLVSTSVETASNLPMFLVLLPFLGSGFVPPASMPSGLRWFAANQPFTPVMDTMRALLMGHADHHAMVLAVVWSVAIAGAGYLWARRLFTTKHAQ